MIILACAPSTALTPVPRQAMRALHPQFVCQSRSRLRPCPLPDPPPAPCRRSGADHSGPRALGVQPTEQDTLAAAELRKHEPWFPEAFAALEAIWRGEDSDENWAKILPFSYGRWDAQAQAHAAADDAQGNRAAAAIYGSAGAFDGTAIRKAFAARMEPVLILGGAADGWPSPRVCTEYAALFPSAELALQPAAGHFPWLDDPAWFTRSVASFLAHSPETAPAA